MPPATVEASRMQFRPFVSAALCLTALSSPAAAQQQTSASPRILVFSKTAGFRHSSIPAGLSAIRTLGAQNNFTAEATEDPTAFTEKNLRRFQAVVFLNTT